MDSLLAGSKIEYISMRSQTITAIKKPLVCRICMVEENLNCIFENDSDTIAEKIRDCGKVEVSRNDGLPELICSNCIKKVDVCFELRLQIQASDTLLRKMYLENYKTTNETFSEEMGEPIEDSYYDDNVPDSNEALEIKLEPHSPEMIEVNTHPDKTDNPIKPAFDPNDLDMTIIKRSKDGRFNCPLCSMNFKAKKNLVRHHKIVHQEERFYCRSCDGVYTTLEYLQAHEIEKHGEGLKAYECDFCRKKFRLLRMLRNHMKNHLAKNKMLADLAEGKIKAQPAPRSVVERTEHMCHICGTAFKGKARVLYHIKTVHAEKPTFVCDLCSQAYKDKKGLVNHKRAVHENHRYQCDQCDTSYRDKYTVNLHKLDKHSNLAPTVECNVCKKLFKHDFFLRRHIRQTHNNRKRPVCEKVVPSPVAKEIKYNYCTACDQSFAHRQLFTDHKAEHNGKFECRVCLRVFVTDRKLTVHNANKHESPMVYCDKCEYHTTRHHQLARHIKFVHDGFRFECEFCDRKFAKKKAADAHRSVHAEQFGAGVAVALV